MKLGIIRPVRFVVPFFVFALLGACTGSSPESAASMADDVSKSSVEVVHGVADRNRDPAVVAIDIGGEALCTGSLVAPNVVLTARHCVSETTEEVECPARSAQITGNRSASSLTILSGDDAESAKAIAKGKSIVTPSSSVLCDEDIALIVLDRSVTGITPLKIRTGAVEEGEHLRLVGYGKSGDDSGAGEKLLRTNVPVVSVTAHEFQTGEATCNGDSGGPAIDEDTGSIVGVVSRGGPTCEGADTRNIFTRVDAFTSLVAKATGSSASAAGSSDDDGSSQNSGKSPADDMGASCSSGSDCSAGVCLESAEGDSSYCSRTCGDGTRCPNGFHCTAAKSGKKVCAEK
ncbi:MAG TPA: S1 family peptidase [Polyangiaceae bacterium]